MLLSMAVLFVSWGGLKINVVHEQLIWTIFVRLLFWESLLKNNFLDLFSIQNACKGNTLPARLVWLHSLVKHTWLIFHAHFLFLFFSLFLFSCKMFPFLNFIKTYDLFDEHILASNDLIIKFFLLVVYGQQIHPQLYWRI